MGVLSRPDRALLGATVALVAMCLAGPARSSSLRFGPYDFTSVFSISKSENRNEVVFGIHLDAQCVPVGDAPVFPYWRMNEKGPTVIEPLLGLEERAYGIERQRVLPSAGAGGKVEVVLRAMPSRPVVVATAPGTGKCEALATLPISGETGFLYNVYVKLSGIHVDYLLLSGWAEDRQRVLHERLAR